MSADSVDFDPERSLERLAAQFERLASYLKRSEDELFAANSRISSWSRGEHLFHIALANQLSLGNALALARGKGMLIRPFGQIHEEAEALLRRGRIPRGRAEAPRFVRPPRAPRLDMLRENFEQSRAALLEARANTDAIRHAPDCIPHQLLGDLSATQWLRFARIHTAHHLVTIRELDRAG